MRVREPRRPARRTRGAPPPGGASNERTWDDLPTGEEQTNARFGDLTRAPDPQTSAFQWSLCAFGRAFRLAGAPRLWTPRPTAAGQCRTSTGFPRPRANFVETRTVLLA